MAGTRHGITSLQVAIGNIYIIDTQGSFVESGDGATGAFCPGPYFVGGPKEAT